jgi:hypothetical protein
MLTGKLQSWQKEDIKEEVLELKHQSRAKTF